MEKYSARKLRAVFLMVGGLGLSFWPEAGAFAQAANAPGGAAPPATDQTVSLEKFTVTGSHIPMTETTEAANANPVIVIDRRTIEQAGEENTAELLQSIPVFNEGAIPISNNDTGFSRGATGISLHGLGPDATLVLFDGHRVAPFPVGQFGNQAFVDLNTLLPNMFWDRIEVVPVGASAIYGADAVAGVVNIIPRKDYNGSEVHLSYQNTTDKDASQFTADLLAGMSNEKGSLMVGFNYQQQNSIADADRSYTLVPALLSTSSNPINAQVTITAYNLALGLPSNHARPAGVTKNIFFVTPGITPGAGGSATPSGNTLSSNGLAVSPSTNFGNVPPSEYIPSNNPQSVYDYNQNAWSLPYWKRYGLVLNGDHKLFGTQNIKGYFDGSYQISRTINQSAPAPTGNFQVPGQTTLVIPANTADPLLFGISKTSGAITAIFANPGEAFPTGSIPGPGTTADANGNAQRLAPAGAYNPFNPFNEDISGTSRYRLQDFGNRVWDDTNEAALGTAGIRGENILDKYDFDAGIRYSESTYRTNDTQVSASKFNQILNANDPIFNPNSPSYIGTTTPYNPFSYYINPNPNNVLLAKYATIHVHDKDFSSLGNGYFTIDTTDLFELPAGEIGASTGLDYRIETLNQAPDPETAAGDVIGEVQESSVDRSRDIGAAFAEIKIPIISPMQQITGLHLLSADIAGRYEDFLTSHEDKFVPQANIIYQPFDGSFDLRGSAGRGFLAPSMFKLYSPGTYVLAPTLVDPRTNAILSEVPVKDVGNSGLHSETSNTYDAGFVWSPKFDLLKGFTTNLDWWRIDRNGTALADNQNTLDRFFGTAPGGMQPGENVFLDPTTGNVVEVVSAYHNAGESIAKGVDLGASYVRQTDSFGQFDFSTAISFLHSFRQANAPGQPLVELVDTSPEITSGEDAYLRRKATTAIDWSYKNYSIGVTGHFLDGFQDFDANGNPRRVGSSWTWDLQLVYAVHNELGAYLKDTTIKVGSINIFDRTPPTAIADGNNPNNYPGTLYTSEGRRIYASLDKEF
jgi:iron complex outermembrane receptor protein